MISGPNVSVTQVDNITLSADLTGVTYQWIDCDNGNQSLNGETNQTFVATANGSYAVIIDNGSCTDTSDCFVVSSVGLSEELNTPSIRVYPNPSNGIISIELGGEYNEVKLILFDNLGRIVANQLFTATKQIELVIDAVPGNYILKLQTNSGHIHTRNIFIE